MRPSERRVARVLQSDYPASALGTVAEIARAAGVSNPTVVRCAHALGFRSFSELQDAVRAELSRLRGPLGKMDHRPRGATAELAGFARAVADSAVESLSRLPAEELDLAIAGLSDPAGRVVTTGGRYSRILAAHLTINLASIRPRVVHLAEPLGTDLPRLVDLQRADTVVLFDFARYQRSMVRVAELAQQAGARIIVITDPGLSPTARCADVVLPVADSAPTPLDSATGSLILVDYLVARVIDSMGRAATTHLAAWERARQGEFDDD